MKTLRKFNKDRTSALLLVVLGAGIAFQGLKYQIGQLTRMGAGFIPVVLGVILALVGVAIGVTAALHDFGDSKTAPTEWRGWLCVMGGVVAFAVIGAYGGLVPATFISVFVAAMGDRSNRPLDAALLAVAVTAVGTLIFAAGLKMSFPLFTWG